MLAALSLNRYKIARSSLGKSCILCFETVRSPVIENRVIRVSFIDIL